MAPSNSLVIGVDVGGTNTDAALLDTSRSGAGAVLASHKAATTTDVTWSVEGALECLLSKVGEKVQRSDIAALAIGTTHFLNAMIERDSTRVEKVAVLRLASHDFSTGTPPFCDWPAGLKRLVDGYSAIIAGGVNLDGKELAAVDPDEVRLQGREIASRGLRNLVVAGIGSPMDERHHQEEQVRDILRAELGEGVNIVCSHNVSGSGLLARENASILNASILNFARRTLRSFVAAMGRMGLKCPLYLTSNDGHLMTAHEAMSLPIRIFSSGATNSVRGAALLAGDRIGQSGCVVVDIGGTTTDVGFVLKNGYPRLSKTYTDIAGVKVNLEMPSVESIGLGGGSIVHNDDTAGKLRIGPDSVGQHLTTKALCFGGDVLTATDVAVALGVVIGTQPVTLSSDQVNKAQARIKGMLEATIDHVKLSPEPSTVILVGGGSILSPSEIRGVQEVILPEHAGAANAIGAAVAKIYGSAELMVDVSKVDSSLEDVKNRAVAQAVSKGGNPASVVILSEEVSWVPYADDQRTVRVEVACPADHGKIREVNTISDNGLNDHNDNWTTEAREHQAGPENELFESDALESVDFDNYRPEISAERQWKLSIIDLKFIEIGCYILGCGGGGSPYAAYLHLRQLILEGEAVTIVRIDDLQDEDMLPPIASIGTPAVGLERPGGLGVLHAMEAMSKEVGVSFQKILAIEIGGSNGLGSLVWGSSRYYNIPTVDGDLMGRAFPNFEMVSQYVAAESINELMPVTICSGTGETSIIPANQTDATSASNEIRRICAKMGFAAGATGNPLSGKKMRDIGLPNTFSLAWRLGRVVCKAQRRGELSTVADALIQEAGGSKSARRIFQGKIRGVRSTVTATAHSLGEVIVERLSEDEMESDADRCEDFSEVVVPFMNENLGVIGKDNQGNESVLATVPDLIFLLDVSTGEAIGVQEYRYGLKVTIITMGPHPLWTSKRGLEIAGPAAFKLPYAYTSTLVYTKPRSVIDEFMSGTP